MRYCPHCGNQVEDEAVVCVKCGRKVLSVSAERRVSNEYEVTFKFVLVDMYGCIYFVLRVDNSYDGDCV